MRKLQYKIKLFNTSYWEEGVFNKSRKFLGQPNVFLGWLNGRGGLRANMRREGQKPHPEARGEREKGGWSLDLVNLEN